MVSLSLTAFLGRLAASAVGDLRSECLFRLKGTDWLRFHHISGHQGSDTLRPVVAGAISHARKSLEWKRFFKTQIGGQEPRGFIHPASASAFSNAGCLPSPERSTKVARRFLSFCPDRGGGASGARVGAMRLARAG